MKQKIEIDVAGATIVVALFGAFCVVYTVWDILARLFGR